MEKNQEYYEKLDKRTKEYKEWKEKRESVSDGLGDSVEKVLKATGIADVVKFIAGEDCGCAERKEKLNQIFPSREPSCFNESDYNWMKEFIDYIESEMDNGRDLSEIKVLRYQNERLIRIYNRTFRTNLQASSCGSCVLRVYKELKTYFDKYSE